MQHVLLKFGICHLVILDDGSPFKGVFSAMCKALHINYEILAKRNHKGLLVKKFHRFLNKAITIAAEDRGTNDIFVAVTLVHFIFSYTTLIESFIILNYVVITKFSST